MRKTGPGYVHRSYVIERFTGQYVAVTACQLDWSSKRIQFERLLELHSAEAFDLTDLELLQWALDPQAHPVRPSDQPNGEQLELPLDPPKG